MTHRVHHDSRFALIDALNAEWSRLNDDPALAGQARSELHRWSGSYPVLAGCGSPEAVLELIRNTPDPALGALIAVHQQDLAGCGCRRVRPGRILEPARTGHPLAGRIVLQTMLGKIVGMALRDHRHGVEDYVGQLWLRLGTFPLTNRPRRIAANLALDTLKALTREQGDVLPYGAALPVPPTDLERIGLPPAAGSGEDPVADLTAHRVLRTAERLGLIDAATTALLRSVYADGLSSTETAARHGLTATTVRFRCSRALRRLARHATAIADAA